MSGILVKYAELLRLSVEQLYYQNNMYRQTKLMPELDIQILPTQDCIDVMNRMNIVFKNTDTNAGFILLANVSGTNAGGDDLLRFAPKKTAALSFLMILKNGDAINFDDLPVQPSFNYIYYFSNDISDAVPRTNLHLSKNAAGVDGTNDVLRRSSANYSFHSPNVILPGSVDVKHILTGQLLDPVSLVTAAGQTDISFNLSSLPLGKCRLLVNNLPVEDFYYLGNTTQPVFGVIEFLLSSTLAANYRIIEADRSLNAIKPYYTITFNNRKTFWRYTIRLQNNSPLYLEMSGLNAADKTDFINKLNIKVTNDATITFSRITATDTEFVFVSDNQLLLHEKYFSSTSVNQILNITLTKYIGDAREAVVKNNLPYAATSNLDASIPSQIYSDIFLTL